MHSLSSRYSLCLRQTGLDDDVVRFDEGIPQLRVLAFSCEFKVRVTLSG